MLSYRYTGVLQYLPTALFTDCIAETAVTKRHIVPRVLKNTQHHEKVCNYDGHAASVMLWV
jgi:hypothetical protein